MALRTLSAIESDVVEWQQKSTVRFPSMFAVSGKIWLLKYMNPQYLAGFLSRKQMAISATPGFTWGDGIYVTPLINPYSTMMYGRVGVLGWLDDRTTVAAYDASDPIGLQLYQEWIQHSVFLFRLLTTTIHSDRANRLLRNAFRRRFGLDVIFFRPDQYNKNYVSLSQDYWFVVADWQGLPSVAPTQGPRFSSKIVGCEWVAVVGEQFQESPSKTQFLDLIGPHLHNLGRTISNSALAQELLKIHKANSIPGAAIQVAHILA